MTGEAPAPETSPPGGEYPDRVRKALAPLLADEATREKVARKIEGFRNARWEYPETSSFFDFAGKVDRVVSHFAADGLTREAYLRAAVRSVPLFFQRPETLIGHIERVVARFRPDGLTRARYLRAAVMQPHLFHRRPETLIGNVERVVRHLRRDGLTRGRYLQAAVRQPSLFYFRPRTIIRHVGLITGLYRDGWLNLPASPDPPPTDTGGVLAFMLHHPTLFAMAEDNIALRERYARAAARPLSARVLMRSSRREIEGRLAGLSPTVPMPPVKPSPLEC